MVYYHFFPVKSDGCKLSGGIGLWPHQISPTAAETTKNGCVEICESLFFMKMDLSLL